MKEICGYCKRNNAYCSYLKNIPICSECIERYYRNKNAFEEKEATTMQVTYNGFTSSPVKLEKTFCKPQFYDLSIYDSEKQVTHSFTGVRLEDVKFSGGEVSFGG